MNWTLVWEIGFVATSLISVASLSIYFGLNKREDWTLLPFGSLLLVIIALVWPAEITIVLFFVIGRMLYYLNRR